MKRKESRQREIWVIEKNLPLVVFFILILVCDAFYRATVSQSQEVKGGRVYVYL